MQKSGKGLATGALVLGLVSLVCAALAIFVPAKIGWLCIVALVLGIIAVVLGSKAKKACVAANETYPRCYRLHRLDFLRYLRCFCY